MLAAVAKTRSIVEAQFGLIEPKRDREGVESFAALQQAAARRRAPLILDPDLALLYHGTDAREVRMRALQAEAVRNRNTQAERDELRRVEEEVKQLAKSKQPETVDIDDEDENSDTDSVAWQADLGGSQKVAVEQEEQTAPQPADDGDANRIEIHLRGPGGVQMNAKVRPTTTLQRIRDHFVTTKGDDIPADKRDKVRLVFDGEVSTSIRPFSPVPSC